jgi:hypothetical protein
MDFADVFHPTVNAMQTESHDTRVFFEE